MSNDKTLLLAGFVLLIYAIVILSAVGMCLVHADALVSGTFKCDADGRVQKMLEQMLTFVGGYLAGKFVERK